MGDDNGIENDGDDDVMGKGAQQAEANVGF